MGGGGSSSAQRQADQNEAERQRQIKQSEASINAIFDSPDRQAQYTKLGSDTSQFFQNDLDKQQTIAARNLKFSLGRSGNAGGSLQIGQGKQLGEDYLRGTVEATRRGNAAAAGLRGSDESTRQALIAAAMGGLDATTASQQASSALRANAEGASADATGNAFANMFGDLSQVYNNSLDAKQARLGSKYGYGALYQPLYGVGTQPQGGG
jgi:hypothetical protein